MVNQGQLKYEAVSERLGIQASQIILDMLARDVEMRVLEGKELVTLFAGILMLVQYKVSRVMTLELNTRFVEETCGASITTLSISPACPPFCSQRGLPSSYRERNGTCKFSPKMNGTDISFENLVYHDTVVSNLALSKADIRVPLS